MALKETGLAFAPEWISWAMAWLVLASVSVRLALLTRQIRFVALHSDCVPAVFAAQVPLQAHQKAAAYTIAKARLFMVELLVGAVTLLGWTLLGGLNALNQVLLDLVRPGLVQEVALVLLFIFINAIIEIPASLYLTFGIESRFGFNRAGWRLWAWDLLTSTFVGLAIGVPLLAMILWLMGTAGPAWWLWAWLVWLSFNVILLWIYPRWIAPMFNRFTPMPDSELTARIRSLMQACGFSAAGLFVMDGSRRSAHANAYFTGFGRSKRVVFFDTLLSKLSPDEMLAVLAHELGHFKLGHIRRRMFGLFGFSLPLFMLLGWLAQSPWFFTGLGVDPMPNAPHNALALLLFSLLAPLFGTFLSVWLTGTSRQHEFEADAFAVAQGKAGALASALLKLHQDNASTLTPDPAYARFHYSHPPAAERLRRLVAAGSDRT